MKKLLGLLAVAPMAITACGGSSAANGLNGVNIGSNTGMMDGILSGDIDFGGTWGDARFNATDDSTVYEDVVAIGVSEHRIANDGIQAGSDMSSEDIFHVQALFQDIVADDTITAPIGDDDKDGNATDEHVLDLYGHANYVNTMTTTKEVSYLDQGKAATTEMSSKTPSATAADGTIFGADGKIKDGETLKITFIPSTNPTHATQASAVLQKWIKDNRTNGSGDVVINIASGYDAAATALESNNIDLAFLPVNTWVEHASSANFILQAGREAQVATLDFDVNGAIYQPDTITNQSLTTRVMNRFSQLYVEDVTSAALGVADADLSEEQIEFKASMENHSDEFYNWAQQVTAYANSAQAEMIAGSYESYIWARNGSELMRDVTENYNTANYENDWTVDISNMSLDYGFTSTTSSSTFLFPSLWLQKHLGSTPKV